MAEGEGAGQQFPDDAGSKFNSTQFIIDQTLARISTVRLVQVKAVNTSAKTVDVQPMVNMIDGDMNATEHGTIFGIPYIIWQFGKNAVLADPVAGDKGVMLVCDRDISAVKASKAIGPPGSPRQFSMSDGLYLGGVLNEEAEQFFKFTEEGADITLKNGNRLQAGTAGWEFTGAVKFNGVVTMQNNLQLAGSIVDDGGSTYAGTITTTGDVVAGTISLKNHDHPYIRPGSGGVAANTGDPNP